MHFMERQKCGQRGCVPPIPPQDTGEGKATETFKIVVAARALGERGRMKGGKEDWGVKLF